MNSIKITLISVFVVIGLCSCSHGGEALTITYRLSTDSVNGGRVRIDSLKHSQGWCEYDSVRFSDNSYAVYRLAFAPQNSLLEYYDNKGRTIATLSHASECAEQTLIYDYDEEGRLIHLATSRTIGDDGLDDNWKGYLEFRQLIADMDYAHPDTAKYEVINIKYDQQGDAVKAYVGYSGEKIVAPKGYKLTIEVKKCTDFWMSDIDGGRYVFHVMMEPKDKNVKKYRICRYVDFVPTMEAYYVDGRIMMTTWHHNPELVSDKNQERGYFPDQEGDLNVYTTAKKDGSKRQKAFRNGLLVYVQKISKYGTVLSRDTYEFISDKKVKVTEEGIDYGTKQLKVKDTRIEKFNNISMYQEDFYVDRENSDIWGNYYNTNPL